MAIGRSAGRSTPQMHHGIDIMGCIWQPFWILQEKVGISSYFSIIRVVNKALYSQDVTPSTPPKHSQMTITNFNYEGSYLPSLICNIVVKADLGRSAGRSIPPSTDILWSKMAIGISAGRSIPLLLTSSGKEWQLADLLADLPPKCILGYILWDVFGSHFRFFKKRWEFPLISQ